MLSSLTVKERMGYGAMCFLLLGAVAYVGAKNSHRPGPLVVQESSPHRPPAAASTKALAVGESKKSEDVVVHVVGAVTKEGVYKLPADSRVIDAIQAAGGPKNADEESLNLAAKLIDGTQVNVPPKGKKPTVDPQYAGGDQGAYASNSSPALTTAGRSKSGKSPSGVIDLNTATADQLQTIPGIGPSTAERILDYRKEHGQFSSVDELTAVGGIGAKKLERMRKWLRV